MAEMNAATLAEIKRKANLGIALSSSTADKQSIYDQTRSSADAEIARKASSGIALTSNSSAYNTQMYNNLLNSKPMAASNTPSNVSSQSYIDGLNEARKNATLSALGKSRDAALSNLTSEKAAIQPKYYDAKNETAAGSQQQSRNFAEFMAARGGTNSGSNAQAELTRGMTLQGNLGSLGRQEAQAYTDVERRTSDLQNAYESDVASATAGIEADRMQAMLTDYYNQQQQELQVAQLMGAYKGNSTLAAQAQKWGQTVDTANLTGTLNGQQTLASKQIERSNFESDRQYEFAVGQQKWENAFQQGQFDFTKAQTAFENTFKEKSFQQSVNEAAASRGLQWASLSQRDKEFVAQEAWNREQFTYQKEQDAIANNLASQKISGSTPLTKNEIEAGYYSNIDKLKSSGQDLSKFFKAEKSNIIADLGKSGYDALKEAYKIYE